MNELTAPFGWSYVARSIVTAAYIASPLLLALYLNSPFHRRGVARLRTHRRRSSRS